MKKNNQLESKKQTKITRKEAIKKTGKYAALTAATFLILSPKESQAGSPPAPGDGFRSPAR